MPARTYRYNSEWMPKGFQHDFDAHIYFSFAQLEFVKSLHEKIGAAFNHSEIFVGDIIPEPIGPHTLPMLEVNFSRAQYEKFVTWLQHERGSLNVLVHPQSGDDYDDHTNGAVWLGTPVDIKLEVFK